MQGSDNCVPFQARRKGIEVKYIPVNFLKHDRDYFFKVFPHLFPASDIIEIPSYATLHTHLKDKLTKMACKVTEADFDAAMDP